MSAHLYWRLFITNSQGAGDPAKEHWHTIAEIQMRSIPGGGDQCTGGTATAHDYYSATYTPGKAFDDGTATWWASFGTNVVPGWIQYTFASGVEVGEIAITSRNDTDFAPKKMKLQWSDDNANWTTVGQWSGIAPWPVLTTRLYRPPVAAASIQPHDLTAIFAKAQDSLPYALSLAKAVGQGYDIEFVRGQVALVYGIATATASTHVYSQGVTTPLAAPYGVAVAAAWEQPYPIILALANRRPWGVPLLASNWQPLYDMVGGQCQHPWSLRWPNVAAGGQPYTATSTVVTARGQPYALLLRNPLVLTVAMIYDLLPVPGLLLGTRPLALRHQGREVAVLAATIGHKQGENSWHGVAELADGAAFQRLAVDETVSLTVGGETFILMVASRTLERNAATAPRLLVTLTSPTAVLNSPRATPLSRTWPTAMTAHQAATQATGWAIDWQLTDWIIAASRLTVDRLNPGQVAQRIVEAAGGVLEATPAGALIARPRFPLAVRQWTTAVPDHLYSDSQHIVAIEEAAHVYQPWGSVVVGDGTGTAPYLAVTVDDRADGLNQGRTRFAPTATAHVLVHAQTGLTVNPPQVSAGQAMVGAVQEYVITEELPFEDSQTSRFSRPVARLQTVTWLGNNLGALTLATDGRQVTAQTGGVGMARVTAVVRAASYAIVPPAGLAGEEGFQIQCHATADGLADRRQIRLQGVGTPLLEIDDPLLTDSRALLARGQSELDHGLTNRHITLTALHRDGVRCGQLVEVHDGHFGRSFRGQVVAIHHQAQGDGVVSRIQLVSPP